MAKLRAREGVSPSKRLVGLSEKNLKYQKLKQRLALPRGIEPLFQP